METIEVSTTVYVSPERAYTFLRDFERYSDYSKYIDSVTANGDAGEGTEYEIRFGWWKLSYGVRTVLTDTSAPSVIGWETCTDIDAHGRWEIAGVGTDRAAPTPERMDTGGDAAVPDDEVTDSDVAASEGENVGGEASVVTLVVTYDADSVTESSLDIPPVVSLDWVVDQAVRLIEEEGRRVVERVVADLEGERRSVDLHVEHRGVSGPGATE